MSTRTHLRDLARRCGIVETYRRADTGETVSIDDDTRERILAAMGVEASTESAAERALAGLDADASSHAVEPVAVTRPGEHYTLHARAIEDSARKIDFAVEVETETGLREAFVGSVAPERQRLSIDLRTSEPMRLGYYRVRLRQKADGAESDDEQLLVVAPPSCTSVRAALGRSRAIGVCANLYSIRTGRDYGFGDLGSLEELCRDVAEAGGDFVGINPLHARSDGGRDASPYLPTSRLFRDSLYIDVTSVPEFADWASSSSAADSTARLDRIDGLRRADHIDYERVVAVKMEILRELHAYFRRSLEANGARAHAYRRFVDRQGVNLLNFATFSALEARFRANPDIGGDWRAWPTPYARPDTDDVATYRGQHTDQIDLHCFLQFEIDRQLQQAAAVGRRAGLGLGIYQDLALGSATGGADAWSLQDDIAQGVTVGAPPDAYSDVGQEWGVAPIIPTRLRATRFSVWREILASAMRCAGAVRIDHAMGLVRQFWVPEGVAPTDGAYIEYPSEGLFAILALESTRAGAVVVGEDLGTVPDGFRDELTKRNIQRSHVLYFERDAEGDFRQAAQYESGALATANTHDLVPLAGFWEGRDLEMRRKAGGIADDEALERERLERKRTCDKLLERLVDEGVVEPGWAPATMEELCDAVTRFLAGTPSALIGIALDDIAAEVEAVNVPGTAGPAYKNWTRRMRLSLGDLADTGRLRRQLASASAAVAKARR